MIVARPAGMVDVDHLLPSIYSPDAVEDALHLVDVRTAA